MFSGDQIRLRAAERDDIPVFVQWINDLEVTRGLTILYPMGIEDETNWFDRMLSKPPELHTWVIEIPANDSWQAIGSCGFNQIDWRNASAELGILIGEKQYWNQGYGTAVMKLLLQVGFESLNLHRIWLRVLANNSRAIHCYEKAGFKHESCQREAEFRGGNYIDVLYMSVLRPEWQPGDEFKKNR